jgi:hypothetical protein
MWPENTRGTHSEYIVVGKYQLFELLLPTKEFWFLSFVYFTDNEYLNVFNGSVITLYTYIDAHRYSSVHVCL